ncbi:SIR2 family protein [Arthrobacter sp. APC 3897]|uniref:SIR2 family protein n=1 Tax=Arthrobacter sp. APC 3897 TaxID=3035204 RepID=UPI0025B2BD26|nr:SIR2 family protein [Arthrobacter sp. APC 3897]MDN3481236.1 SIR2 family protein [Arthrobacter sp. APC 3897]
MTSSPPRRPVYVLGAGFSKAISSAMPITNELGQALRARLSHEVDFDLYPNQTFEDWLTLQITPLPFLQGFENSRRSANAARVIAEIAQVLDEKVEDASSSVSELWLQQLVALWHAERAVVLTFNYDTLLERAVNDNPPSIIDPTGHARHILGDHVVFPAPSPPPVQLADDMTASHSDESFEILKLHGSLTWYWAANDSSGSTLIRVREKKGYGANTALTTETDFLGITSLDRYLIPPITSKDGYYGSYLANSIWRKARSYISSASALTLIGYSLPPEDRAASQLMAQAPANTPFYVVDRAPGSVDTPASVLGNLTRLGISGKAAGTGPECLPDFVSKKIQEAIQRLPEAPEFQLPDSNSWDVVVAVAEGQSWWASAFTYMLQWNEQEGHFEAAQLGYDLMTTERPYSEILGLEAPSAGSGPLTVAQLRHHVDGGKPLTFKRPHSNGMAVCIGVNKLTIRSKELLELKWAPYS